MGCCESKLLAHQPNEYKYETGPIQLNQNYIPNKKNMVTICLPDAKSSHSRESLCSLRSGLEIMLEQFQKNKGPITYTFLQRKMQGQKQKLKQKFTKQSNIDLKQNGNSIQQNIKYQYQQFINTQYNSNSNISSQEDEQQASFYQQQNTKIISQASLSTKRQLEKQLFYINSSCVNGVELMKWSEANRLPMLLDEHTLIQGVKLGNFQLFIAFLQILYYQQRYKVKLFAYKELNDGNGYRLYVNGIKRMLKLGQIGYSYNKSLHLFSQLPNLFDKIVENNISFWLYVMIGWIPQIISLKQFNNIDQILRRLMRNYNNSNIIIGFGDQSQSKFFIVKGIDQTTKSMNVMSLIKGQEQNFVDQQCSCSWNQICQNYSTLYVNWNPHIYNFNKKMQGTFIHKKQNNLTMWNDLKYSIKIPPSKSQVQVRIFAQIHYLQFNFIQGFQIDLYQNNSRQLNIQQKLEPIRKLKSLNPYFLSQIFLFQRSNQYGYYTIVINVMQKHENYQNLESNKKFQYQKGIQLTLDLYTFCQVNIKAIKQPLFINKKSIRSQIGTRNAGFGMNSPFFNKNLQYSIKLKQDNVCRLSVKAFTQKPLLFQICALPDNYQYGDITLIRPEQLVKQVIQSQQFQGYGVLQFQAKRQNYIIIIVVFTPTIGYLDISSQFFSFDQPLIDDISNQQMFNMKQINSEINFTKQLNFSWSLSSPGPRKRTKTNSQMKFYPIQTFQKYFKNPFIDQLLPLGFYQFSIISKTFSQSFQQSQLIYNEQYAIQKFVQSTPPSLSMAIYLFNKDFTEVKIILDDVQYVPYGIGFWTSPMQLEGNYRFVFSKIERSCQNGVFRIRKMNQNNFK